MKTEMLLCPVCEEDLRGAGYEIQALDKSYRMDRCAMCEETSPVRKVRLTKKRRKTNAT